MNRKSLKMNTTGLSPQKVSLTEGKMIGREQFYSTVVEQNSVKFTSEKSLVNEDLPKYKKSTVLKLDYLSPLTAQSN